jgi:hypothetical protein
MAGRVAIDQELFDSPQLPTWKHPALRDVEADLDLLLDCWVGLRGKEAEYLPKEQKEPDQAYKSRLQRATYVPSFRKAVEAMAGILSQFSLIDLPASMEDELDDIDQLGDNITAFLAMADGLAMRDGGCAVMVEMPQQTLIQSEADRIALGRNPYLILIERGNILNWKTETIGGQERLMQATIVEWRQVDSGDFGFSVEPFFRVLTPGAFQVYAVQKGTGGRSKLVMVEEGITSIQEVPLVWYAPQPQRWGEGALPFRELALLTLQHYRSRSDLSELLHRCALPVPVRRGALLMDGQTPPPLVIGPNSVVDVPVDGDFSFAEPSGSSLQQQQEHLKHIEQLINAETLSFMVGQEAMTATQARLQAGQVQSGLALAGMQKASLFEQIQMLWCEYTGEEPTGSFQIASQALQAKLEPQEVQQIKTLADGGYISKSTTLELLQRGGILPNDFDIEQEVTGMQAADQVQLQQQIARDQRLMEQGVMLPPGMPGLAAN